MATEDQKRKINHTKNLFYHKHNQEIPEDAVVMWDQRLMHMLSIMKGAKESKMDKLEWNRNKEVVKEEEEFVFKEFNIDEAFMNGEF